MSGNEEKFDQQMIDILSEVTPPEAELGKMNPWSKPIVLITWGLTLSTIRFNFLYLGYILPVLGILLVFLGFRSLRDENVFFKLAWVISILKLIFQLVELFRISSPLNTVMYSAKAALFMVLLQIIMYLLFHKALKETFEKAGKSMTETPLIWAALWTAAISLIALSPLSASWLVFIPMMILYFYIIKSLSSIGDQLDDTGYFLANSRVRISNQLFGWSYLALSLMIVIACSINFNHLRLDHIEYQKPSSTVSRENLLRLEFPADALKYLSDEDVEKLAYARSVEVSSEILMFDPVRIEHVDTSEAGITQITSTSEKGDSNLDVSTIYIEMPDNVIYVMHYFKWVSGSPYWQDGITIFGQSEVEEKEIVSSGLFYTIKEIDYTANFPRLASEVVTSYNMFGSYTSEVISGALSYPFDSEAQGGYVLHRYRLMADTDMFITYTTLNYYHETSPIQLPYRKVEEAILNGGFFFDDELQQSYTTYISAASKERERELGPSD